ncbi:MAG: hypothetical protein ABIT37_13735 [Luteolibacter sp.]
MFTKLDEKFQATLDNDAELERQLSGLAEQRRRNTFIATAMAVYIFGHALFVLVIYQRTISTKNPMGLNVPPGMVLLPLLFSILVLQFAIKAVVAHCEIRSLLTFKKLRELQERTEPT